MRIPKDAFFAHQVMWDGWVDPEHPRIHINGHWNYPAGTKRTVYIEATTALVELKINGRSLGTVRPTHDFLFTFPDVVFERGTLTAIGYDANQHPIVATTLSTAGPPASIRLTLQTGPGGLHADGSDLALVDVEVVDKSGRRVPTALNMIHFALTGPAEWRGGIAQGTAKPVPINAAPSDTQGLAATPVTPFLHYDNYILSRELPVEGGINRVSIRSTERPGAITLTARADGLPPAHLTIESHPEPQRNGLSTFDPAKPPCLFISTVGRRHLHLHFTSRAIPSRSSRRPPVQMPIRLSSPTMTTRPPRGRMPPRAETMSTPMVSPSATHLPIQRRCAPHSTVPGSSTRSRDHASLLSSGLKLTSFRVRRYFPSS